MGVRRVTPHHIRSTRTGVIGDAFAAYDVVPFGLVEDDFITYAMTQFSKRFTRLEKARGASLDEINHVAHETEEA